MTSYVYLDLYQNKKHRNNKNIDYEKESFKPRAVVVIFNCSIFSCTTEGSLKHAKACNLYCSKWILKGIICSAPNRHPFNKVRFAFTAP